MHLARSTISTFSDASDLSTGFSRKRSRHDYDERMTTPMSLMGEWTNGADMEDVMMRSGSIDPGSPVPFVNTRYQISGGLDTPSAVAEAVREGMEETEYSDVRYRRDMIGTKRPLRLENEGEHNLSYFPRIETPQSVSSSQNQGMLSPGNTWGSVAISVVGGVVGKVWEFCKAGAFRGFIAGGGTRYNTQAQPYSLAEDRAWADEIAIFNQEQRQKTGTPVPGMFPDGGFIEDYMDHATPETTPLRPSKRRQVSNPRMNDELAKNWVMVPPTSTSNAAPVISSSIASGLTSTPNIPINRKNQHSKAAPARYSMPTTSSASRRLAATSTASRPASRAGGRKTLLSSHRPSVSHAGSPGLHASQPASYASPRSPGGSRIPLPITQYSNSPVSPLKLGFASPRPGSFAASTNGVGMITTGMGGVASPNNSNSPAAIEAQRWAARKKKEDKEADESIRRFNARLKALIREGKEALGTTVSVHDENEDGDEVEF
jgi:hypothetical protein